jgi:nitrogen-specific signal transduction histidine kinase
VGHPPPACAAGPARDRTFLRLQERGVATWPLRAAAAACRERRALLAAAAAALPRLGDAADAIAADGRLLLWLPAGGARDGDGALAIGVRDSGPGVPPGEREAIFERFRRGAAHRHGSIPGVGLGRHLARAIVRHHGGDLVCAAPADGGAGAEFVVTLPCEPEEPA